MLPVTLKYQAFYCEENIWHLCQHPDYQDGHVVFISALGDYFPMFHQRNGRGENRLIFWDYHVVLLQAGMIHDFNSSLSFSTPIEHYFDYSFALEHQLEPPMIPRFRVLPAADYTTSFLSDRRHMKSESGWQATPPDWPAISDSSSNLKQFCDMSDFEYGDVLTQSELLIKYS